LTGDLYTHVNDLLRFHCTNGGVGDKQVP
jgi:hypothetical protein